jgi:hypothetical protein
MSTRQREAGSRSQDASENRDPAETSDRMGELVLETHGTFPDGDDVLDRRDDPVDERNGVHVLSSVPLSMPVSPVFEDQVEIAQLDGTETVKAAMHAPNASADTKKNAWGQALVDRLEKEAAVAEAAAEAAAAELLEEKENSRRLHAANELSRPSSAAFRPKSSEEERINGQELPGVPDDAPEGVVIQHQDFSEPSLVNTAETVRARLRVLETRFHPLGPDLDKALALQPGQLWGRTVRAEEEIRKMQIEIDELRRRESESEELRRREQQELADLKSTLTRAEREAQEKQRLEMQAAAARAREEAEAEAKAKADEAKNDPNFPGSPKKYKIMTEEQKEGYDTARKGLLIDQLGLLATTFDRHDNDNSGAIDVSEANPGSAWRR